MKKEESNSRIKATCYHLRSQFHFAQAEQCASVHPPQSQGDCIDKDTLEGDLVPQ